MESTGIYHLPVERYFKEQGFNTLVINSLTTKNNYDTLRKEHNDLIKADKTGEGYIKDMFVSELENHEYGYTYELDDTLDALELTREQIANSPNLKHGLDLAKKEVLKKENEVNLDYE